MREKKIVVVGGSIAGCAMAILLKRLGADVLVLERSSGRFATRGAGIMLPVPVVDQCIALDLFDANIPRLVVNGRSFSRKSTLETAEKFWDQSINVVALNWIDIYRNLRRRINPISYCTQITVKHIQKTDDGYEIKTADGKIIFADYVIAADGVDSTVRKQLVPTAAEEYAKYIAWRGIAEDAEFNCENHAPYFVFPNGHILLYRIPAADYTTTGKTLLNWVMYENNQTPLSKLLKDKQGRVHKRSLPMGSLPDERIQYLHAFAQLILPKSIADVVYKTQHPFIQAIFDFQLPIYEGNDFVFAGDAAATLRPHSASGVLKALMNAISFYKLISENPSQDLSTLIAQWKTTQTKTDFEEILKAKAMGRALVTHPPHWNSMTQKSTDQWWSFVMQGKTWYATDSRSKKLFVPKKIVLSGNDDKNHIILSKL